MPSFSKIACFNTVSGYLTDVLGDFRVQVQQNRFKEVISSCSELAFDKGYRFLPWDIMGDVGQDQTQ